MARCWGVGGQSKLPQSNAPKWNCDWDGPCRVLGSQFHSFPLPENTIVTWEEETPFSTINMAHFPPLPSSSIRQRHNCTQTFSPRRYPPGSELPPVLRPNYFGSTQLYLERLNGFGTRIITLPLLEGPPPPPLLFPSLSPRISYQESFFSFHRNALTFCPPPNLTF